MTKIKSTQPDRALGKPQMGVVIVTYNAAEVISECLESLFASSGVDLWVTVVDNASPDQTRETIRSWASGKTPFQAGPACPIAIMPVTKPLALDERSPDDESPPRAQLALVNSPVNGGYAYGVNLGLKLLSRQPNVTAFWILNPDSVVPSEVPSRFMRAVACGPSAMLGGRCRFYEKPDLIQTDGGSVNRWTGVCSPFHLGCPASSTRLPDSKRLDFLTGASMVLPRAFVEEVGPMPEDYFLYYEEVDWAFRRGDFEMQLVPQAEIFHRGGFSINAGMTDRRQTAFANYFTHRNRLRFVRRHMPSAFPIALIWTAAKAAQLVLRGGFLEARATLMGAFGMSPPSDVRARIADPKAMNLAFGRDGRSA